MPAMASHQQVKSATRAFELANLDLQAIDLDRNGCSEYRGRLGVTLGRLGSQLRAAVTVESQWSTTAQSR
jgi:hypothetical protein